MNGSHGTISTKPSARHARPFKEAKRELLDQFETVYLQELMRRHGHNLSAASRESGLSRRYLRSLLRRHGFYRAATRIPGYVYVRGYSSE